MGLEELENEQRLTKVEEAVKSAHHRINNVESMQKEIRDLTLSVNTLAGIVGRTSDDVSKVCGRVEAIEAKPGKRLDLIVTVIITSLVTGVLGFVIGMILK